MLTKNKQILAHFFFHIKILQTFVTNEFFDLQNYTILKTLDKRITQTRHYRTRSRRSTSVFTSGVTKRATTITIIRSRSAKKASHIAAARVQISRIRKFQGKKLQLRVARGDTCSPPSIKILLDFCTMIVMTRID